MMQRGDFVKFTGSEDNLYCDFTLQERVANLVLKSSGEVLEIANNGTHAVVQYRNSLNKPREVVLLPVGVLKEV